MVDSVERDVLVYAVTLGTPTVKDEDFPAVKVICCCIIKSAVARGKGSSDHYF